MANTYKIKPLEWHPHFSVAFNAYLDGCHIGQAALVEGKWVGVCFDPLKETTFDSLDDAKAFVENWHIAKVREFLEVLE